VGPRKASSAPCYRAALATLGDGPFAPESASPGLSGQGVPPSGVPPRGQPRQPDLKFEPGALRMKAALPPSCAYPRFRCRERGAARILPALRVFDGTDPAPHPGWQVLVEGERITAVGPNLAVAGRAPKPSSCPARRSSPA